MTGALLLDLDDTLLHNRAEEFLPRYFQALTAAVAAHVAPEPFLSALHHATRCMMTNIEPGRTNESIFWGAFEPMLPVGRTVLEPILRAFYSETFPALQGTAGPVPGAEALITEARKAGWKVALATNPVFPLIAIQHRIVWAGLDDLAFDYITAYENMCCTKPHPDYFLQIARELDVAPANCVMAGNHLADDLVGAAEIGMKTFWVTTYPLAGAQFEPDGQGSLDDLRAWLFDGPAAEGEAFPGARSEGAGDQCA